MNNNYYNKYLKYKNKYLILKNQNKKEINNINGNGEQHTDVEGEAIINTIIQEYYEDINIEQFLYYLYKYFGIFYTEKIIKNIISFNEKEYSSKIIYKMIKFQDEILNRCFLATTEESYECNENNNFYNIEWIYNGTIDYSNIIDSNNYLYVAIESIANFSSACDNDEEQNICTNGPQQTHIHVSYKNLYFTDKEEYFNFLKILSLYWIHEYQNIFNTTFIEDFDKWANDNRDACGKPLIFTTSEDEARQIFARYNANFPLYTTNFNGEIYYTNIPFEDISKYLDDPDYDVDIYNERYIDLNITPSWSNSSNLECHVEFRALNNLIRVGGGAINNYIINRFGNIYNFLAEFVKNVSELFKKVFNNLNLEFDENSLIFGIEIETCTHIV